MSDMGCCKCGKPFSVEGEKDYMDDPLYAGGLQWVSVMIGSSERERRLAGCFEPGVYSFCSECVLNSCMLSTLAATTRE
jgi:hypothetical protein